MIDSRDSDLVTLTDGRPVAPGVPIAGFRVYATGGNLTAWRRDIGPGLWVLITGEDGASHEIDPGESYFVGLHSDDGAHDSDSLTEAATPEAAIAAAARLTA